MRPNVNDKAIMCELLVPDCKSVSDKCTTCDGLQFFSDKSTACYGLDELGRFISSKEGNTIITGTENIKYRESLRIKAKRLTLHNDTPKAKNSKIKKQDSFTGIKITHTDTDHIKMTICSTNKSREKRKKRSKNAISNSVKPVNVNDNVNMPVHETAKRPQEIPNPDLECAQENVRTEEKEDLLYQSDHTDSSGHDEDITDLLEVNLMEEAGDRANAKQGVYKCDTCGREFKHQSNLIAHCRIHSGHRPHECDICKKMFRRSTDLRAHLRTHTGEKPYLCKLCGSTFTQSKSLVKHARIHNSEKPHQCNVCKKTFRSAEDLKGHSQMHTSESGKIECPECPKSFLTFKDFNVHLRTHTGDKPYVCDICGMKFSQRGSLNRHTHTRHKKAFPTLANGSENGANTVERQKICMCDICGKGFTHPENLRKHSKRHDDSNKESHKCDDCDKMFITSGELKRHRMTHTGERPFTCNVCGKGWSRKFELFQHSKIHTGEKPHECNICHQTFRTAVFLREHSRRHSGEKPFICEVCGRRFTAPSGLRHHAKTHSEERPYKCELCDLRFKKAANLHRHQQTHSGQKPYVCEICGKRLSDLYWLKEHSRMHGIEKAHRCDICGKEFYRASNLRFHYKKHRPPGKQSVDACGKTRRKNSRKKKVPIKCPLRINENFSPIVDFAESERKRNRDSETGDNSQYRTGSWEFPPILTLPLTPGICDLSQNPPLIRQPDVANVSNQPAHQVGYQHPQFATSNDTWGSWLQVAAADYRK